MITEIPKHKTIHFIGIGGSGMSPLAHLLLEKDFRVQGSDLKETIQTIRLRDAGAKIFIGHKKENLREADIIVFSTAITPENDEYKYAEKEKIPLLRRADMLALVMQDYKSKIAVTGTHGKTTTTAIIANIFKFAKKRPGYMVGADLLEHETPIQNSENNYFFAEADESDGSFLKLHHNIGIITNIEPEHMDFYKAVKNLENHFLKFMKQSLKDNGYLIVNKDDKTIMKLIKKIEDKQIHYYSIETPSEVMASNIKYGPQGASFQLKIKNKIRGEIQLRLHGIHNVSNTLAAISYALKENIPIDIIQKSLFDFSGTKRRFQLIGNYNNISIYDDYAHHPTEIKLTLEGIKKSLNRRTICIFQPHRYTRTRDLLESFPAAFNNADIVIITEIYSANEQQIKGLSGKLIVEKMKNNKKQNAIFIPKKSNIAHHLLSIIKKDDIIITMGAGDINTVGRELLARLSIEQKNTE